MVTKCVRITFDDILIIFPSFYLSFTLSFFQLLIQGLYYLRAFEATGGLIRMIFKIFVYTAPYLLILLIVLLGAANRWVGRAAYYILTLNFSLIVVSCKVMQLISTLFCL
jgi:hypothetical protein